MIPSRKKDKSRSVFDVQTSHEKRSLFRHGKILNLKPKFRVRHPWIWTFGAVVVVVLIFFSIRELSTRAEVQDFNPSTCLGNWQNPANAEGTPETLANASATFSANNSAVYASGTEIFCGGFLPTTFATSGAITNVGLTLVWQMGDVSTGTVPTTPLVPVNDETSVASSSLSSTTSTTVTASTTDTDMATSTDDTASSSAGDTDQTTSTNSSSPTSTPTPPTVITPAPTSVSTSTTTSAPTDTDDTSSSSAPTSFLERFIATAFADEETTTTASATIVVGPTLVVNLASSSPSSTVSSTAISNSSGTPVIVPPPPPDDNFLDVSYSTDGQTWISVGQVNINNWQQFTVTLPISNWTDLGNLQIRVEGIPTTQDPVPPIYLDGMFMEVHYDAASPIDLTDTASSTDETISSTPLTSATPVRITLQNPGAAQTCVVEPFSETLPLGGTAQFMVTLRPSINGVSYDLLTGYLPQGISASFSDPAGAIAATSSLTLQAAADAQQGSLNIPIIYHEQESDGSTLSNFCQLNIDVQ